MRLWEFGGGGGLNFEGEWDIATPYFTDDIVRYNNTLYVAAESSTGVSPGAPAPATVPLGTQTGGSFSDRLIVNATNTRWAFPFTVSGAIPTPLAGVQLTAKSNPVTAGTLLQLWSQSGTDPDAMLTSGIVNATVAPGVDFTVTYDAPYSLIAGVVYYHVMVWGGGIASIKSDDSVGSHTGIIASIPSKAQYYNGAWSAPVPSYGYPHFVLMGPDPDPDLPWDFMLKGGV